jgi:hypothetical protein
MEVVLLGDMEAKTGVYQGERVLSGILAEGKECLGRGIWDIPQLRLCYTTGLAFRGLHQAELGLTEELVVLGGEKVQEEGRVSQVGLVVVALQVRSLLTMKGNVGEVMLDSELPRGWV